MGQFVVAFSFVIVILQATTILLDRPASTWSFSLLEAQPNTAVALLHNFSNNSVFEWSAATGLAVSQQQAACQQRPGCLLRAHGTRSITAVLKEWNPHAILLLLCCIQLLICLSKTQHNHELKNSSAGVHMPLSYAVALFTLLLLVVLILEGIKHPALVQYPTILTIVLLIACAVWYVWNFEDCADDGCWTLTFHMQLVSVPLAVLSIATMGARLWTDVITHAVLLSAAVNCLWLQSNVVQAWALQLCRLLTILLPTLSLALAHMQWGYSDSWLYAVALMGCSGLLPLYIFTILVPESDQYRTDKIRLRMAHLCTAGALLSLVVNLAMFNEQASH